MQDEIFMARALELARRGRFTTTPNPNVGCVIARNGEIVGEGYHYRAGEPHAEIHALRMAGEKARGATAYVTLEPCSHHGRTPPCCDALITAGIGRVVAAMQDPNPQVAGRGLHRIHQAGIDVNHGLLGNEAEVVNRGFLKRMRTGFPWVQVKTGISIDGRTAMASGESQWITSTASRLDVQRWRAQSSAILSSSATVLADDPSLTVRWSELDEESQSLFSSSADLRQPVRVIIDSQCRVQPIQHITKQPGETWLVRPHLDTQLWPAGVEQIPLALHQGRTDLMALLLLLGRRQINTLWVEAGAALTGALLSAGVVDELIVYMAPKLLGDNARGLCHLPGLTTLSRAPHMVFSDVRQIGPDLRIILTPATVA